MQRIGLAIPATPVTLACLAAKALGQARMEAGVDRGDMVVALRACVDELAARGAAFAVDNPYEARERERQAMALRVQGREDLVGVAMQVGEAEDLREILRLALDVTAKRGVLERVDGMYRSRRWDLVCYYARSLEAPKVEGDGQSDQHQPEPQSGGVVRSAG
jgi:hypothetical protein